MDPAIGIHEGAYFVSKRELFEWLSQEFGLLNVRRVEECGNGVAYLKIFNRLFPDKVNLKKAKLSPQTEYDRLHNLKLLQTAFISAGVERNIDINKLAKCQSLDNLEFLQWCYSFYAKLTSGMGAKIGAPTQPATHLGSGTNGRMRSVERASSSGRQSSAAPRCRGRLDDIEKLRDSERRLRTELQKTKDDFQRTQTLLTEAEHDIKFFWGKLRRLELMTEEPDRNALTVEEVQAILFDPQLVPDEEEDEIK